MDSDPILSTDTIMVRRNTLRFGIGTADCPYTTVWRLWANKSDVYLSVRSLAGSFKLSLHESGVWTSAYTEQSGVKVKEFGGGRRHTTWSRPTEFMAGWTRGPKIMFPYVPWAGDFKQSEFLKDCTWFPAPTEGKFLEVSLFFSSLDDVVPTLEVLGSTGMYEEVPLRLANGQYVWLCARLAMPDANARSHVDWLDQECRGFDFNGKAANLRDAFCLEVLKDEPLAIVLPLGRQHCNAAN